jgi:hypothetical protein
VVLFFLSYAHGESDDAHVPQFFGDLSAELRTRSGLANGETVGFQDNHDLRIGDSWPHALAKALATADIFIALCTPRYFKSEYCGKEWHVFANRVAAQELLTGRRARNLIPLFWVPTQVPENLAHIQHHDLSFGRKYHDVGLLDLMRIRRNRDDYLEFLGAVARRVNEAANAFPLPPLDPPPDLRVVPSAFHEAAAAAPATSEPPARGKASLVPRPRPPVAPDEWPKRPILRFDAPDPLDEPT